MVKGLILAAGEGKRLKPLSDILPKPLLPIQGKAVINWTISAMKQAGINDIGIVIHPSNENIFKEYLDQYFSKLNYSLFFQKTRDGIVSAIQKANTFSNQTLVACAGDTKFKSVHIKNMIDSLSKADMVIAIKKRTKSQIQRRSNVVVNDSLRIIETKEKPKIDEIKSPWSAVPLWGFSDSIWSYFPQSPRSERGEYDLEGTVELVLKDDKFIKGIPVDNVPDITFPRDILITNFKYIAKLINEN